VVRHLLTRAFPRRRPQRPLRAVLVEDDADIRSVAEELLLAAGCDLVLVANPERAVELAEHGEPFDVLVTDVVMPGMDGVELANRLRAYRPELPVLFISGERRVEPAVARSEVIEKPLDGLVLARTLAALAR
jgi:two-component system, cell cycle sensor histidine kinase and response regulator CckA